MRSDAELKAEFDTEGAILLRGILASDDFAPIEEKLLAEINKVFPCGSIQDPEWICHAAGNPDSVTRIYREVADLHESLEFGKSANIKSAVRLLLGPDCQVYQKIPFRIDIPLETKELAVWHQDDFYVKGAPNELTAWIPLQDTPMHVGALGVIKGSHKKGQIPHTIKWGKKMMPEGVFDSPVSLVEMNKGDVLVFNSFTLHTSNINFSDKIRYSVQIRFTSPGLGNPSTIMGEVHEL